MKLKNSKVTHEDFFKDRPILKFKEGLIIDYLQRISNTLDYAVEEHTNTMAVRIDLRLPKSMIEDKPNLMKNFFASLDAQIQADLRRKVRGGKTKRRCRLRYVWVKEKDNALHYHYHLVLMINKNVYNCLGSFNNNGNLSYKIKTAWVRTLGVDKKEGGPLVHFPERSVYHLNARADGFHTECNNLFKRLSYFAKVRTKVFGAGGRNFGCSLR